MTVTAKAWYHMALRLDPKAYPFTPNSLL
jgi:hypothetical protein